MPHIPKEDRDKIFRRIESKLIDEWEDYDLRVTCQSFDIFESGCYGCKHNSIGRGRMGLDYRLTCHLEQEIYRHVNQDED